MSSDQSTIIRVIAQEEAVSVFAAIKHLSAMPQSDETDRHLMNGDTVLILAGEIGYALLNFNPAYPSFKRLDIPEIQDLNVHPDHRRQGVAESLVLACEDEAHAQGADMIGLGVGLGARYGAAQRLYCRMGYLPDGAGLIYDTIPVPQGNSVVNDDDLCLMMVKSL